MPAMIFSGAARAAATNLGMSSQQCWPSALPIGACSRRSAAGAGLCSQSAASRFTSSTTSTARQPFRGAGSSAGGTTCAVFRPAKNGEAIDADDGSGRSTDVAARRYRSVRPRAQDQRDVEHEGGNDLQQAAALVGSIDGCGSEVSRERPKSRLHGLRARGISGSSTLKSGTLKSGRTFAVDHPRRAANKIRAPLAAPGWPIILMIHPTASSNGRVIAEGGAVGKPQFRGHCCSGDRARMLPVMLTSCQ